MRIESLVLEDFRNYEREAVELEPGLNLVLGRNAQGKTNLLEAVYCLSGLGSPRSNDALLVRSGSERALLHAKVERSGRLVDIDIEFRPGRGSRALLNKTPLPRTRSLSEYVVGVFFGPDELSLVKGSPDGRRRFLDDLIVKMRPAREELRREWDRVLKQRNALLKSAPRGSRDAVRDTLQVWDEAFCRIGSELAAARLRALGTLAPYAAKRYVEVAGGGHLELGYTSSWMGAELAGRGMTDPGGVSADELASALAEKLAEVGTHELERGMSLAGPQRDDVSVILTSAADPDAVPMDARAYGSQGDQRTCALALKLAEHDLLTDVLDDEPILLLDDAFSELDPRRREWLKDAVRGRGQTLLSTAEASPADVGADRVLEIRNGRVVRGE